MRAAAPVPICTGEKIEGFRDFLPFIIEGGIDVLHPDLCWCGGISGGRKIAELAEHYGLPKAISDLIPQHHGTTVVEYFYNRAIEMGDESVRENDFRYDGPKPQTKEGGILMLADSVESAARTLAERTPNRVRQLVRNIIQQKFTGGELDECALTLQDLHGRNGN